jgi:hypothetical protein
MDVILDSNIYIGPLLSQGRSIFSSNAFVELFTYLRRTKSNLILPGPVFHEVIKKYSDIIGGSIKKAQDSWISLQHDTMSVLMDCSPPDRDAEVKRFWEKLLNPGLGFQVILLEDYKEISVAEVVRRGVHRVRPANSNGEELRDVVIWLIAKEHARAQNSTIAFVADDGQFKASDGSLHPDLQKEVTAQKIDLLFYDSIPKFIRENALELSPVMPEEIALMVKEGSIAALVTQRFESSEFDDIMIGEIQFKGAQKYKVADDSYYVEAKYVVVVRYSEITTPFIAKTQSGGFSRIGQTRVPLSSLIPTTLRKNYEGVIDLVLSFGTVSGESQSIEILHVELAKNTLLTEVPIIPSEDYFIP